MKNRKRLLCSLLSFLILLSLVPLSAFAEGESAAPVVTAEEADTLGAAHSDAQEGSSLPDGLSTQEDAPSENDTPPEDVPPLDEAAQPEESSQPEEPKDDPPADESAAALPADGTEPEEGGEHEAPAEDAPAEPSGELLLIWELLDALPSPDALAGMSEEELSCVDELITRILDTYELLSEEEQALVDLSPLEALTAASGTQTLAYVPEEPPFAVTITPDSPVYEGTGRDVTITIIPNDSSRNYQFYFGDILVNVDGSWNYDTYHSPGYSKNNTLNYHYMAPGDYKILVAIGDFTTKPVYVSQNVWVYFTVRGDNSYSIEALAQKVVNECEAQGFQTEYEKAVFYHDWLVEHVEYNSSYAGAYSVFTRGISNCQGYHDAFKMLLAGSGIMTDDVYLEHHKVADAIGNGHIWTRVRLDGEWTLIDVTWDDTYDPYLTHMYLGLTDELMQRAHSEHKIEYYACDSLERNYMIRSGSITAMSDPIKEEILKSTSGTYTIPAATGNNVPSVYYKILCPLAAYYLEKHEPALQSASIKVSYDPDTKAYTVSHCPNHNSDILIPGTPASCTATGLTEGRKCSSCGITVVHQELIPMLAHAPETDPGKLPSGFEPGLTEGSHCSVCGEPLVAQQEYFDTVLVIPSGELTGSEFWADGVRLDEGSVLEKDGKTYLELSRSDASSLVTYTYNTSGGDPHEVYPVGMKVWMLGRDDSGYTAAYVPDFDDLLKYGGSSIRITGVTGIRMITGIRQEVKSALTGRGLAGYTLLEYGTVLGLASEVSASSLVLDAPNAKHNYAYKRGVADPVFASGGGVTQYTNVLVGFNEEQCREDLVMRPYIVLRSADGRDVTVYGGVVQRSIGYIAYQNRSVFSPGSSAYNYVWDIIRSVYGNRYDAEHEG